jgi:hypothetical protein
MAIVYCTWYTGFVVCVHPLVLRAEYVSEAGCVSILKWKCEEVLTVWVLEADGGEDWGNGERGRPLVGNVGEVSTPFQHTVDPLEGANLSHCLLSRILDDGQSVKSLWRKERLPIVCLKRYREVIDLNCSWNPQRLIIAKTKRECCFSLWTSLDMERVLVGINAKVNSFETHYTKEIYWNHVLTQYVFVFVKEYYKLQVRFHMTGSCWLGIGGYRGQTGDVGVKRDRHNGLGHQPPVQGDGFAGVEW